MDSSSQNLSWISVLRFAKSPVHHGDESGVLFPPSEEILVEAFEEEKEQIKKEHRHSPKTKRWSVAKFFRLWTSESYFRAPVLKTREKKTPTDFLLFFQKEKPAKGNDATMFSLCQKKNNNKAELMVTLSWS